MDNLAHALVGAALGRAVADRRVPAAALIGAVAGNAPDWAELLVTPRVWAAPHEGASYLVYHRGITHSLLGAALEIVALSGLLGLLLSWRARRARAIPPSWLWIAACVAVTVASHLYLDWQGSYGLRPFLPWRPRWYYGDWVAIVDPFFWVVPLVALAWGAPRHWAPALAYALTLGAVLALVLGAGQAPVVWWVQVLVVGGAAACGVGWTRHWFGVAGRRRAAAYGLLTLAIYAAASGAASGVEQARVHAAAIRRFGPRASWAALTMVGRPFHWEAMLASADTVAAPGWALARHLNHPAVRHALATPRGRAIQQFARFLVAAVDSAGGQRRVSLWDARYHRGGPGGPGAGSWAAVEVEVR